MKSYLLDIERKPPIGSTGDKVRLHMSERNIPFSDEFFRGFILTLKQEDFINYSNCEDLRVNLAREHNVYPENIFIGAGSDYVLNTIFNAFVTDGSYVAMPEAHFPMYDVYLAQNRGKAFHFKYKLNQQNYLELDANDFENLPNPTSLIVLGNPNSPVGDVVSSENIHKLLSYGVPVVLDQVYGDFGKTEIPIDSIGQNCIFVNSFSKSAGAAGCRVGYAVAKRSTILLMNAFRQMFEISTVSKKFVNYLLDNKGEVFSYINSIVKERSILQKRLPYVQYGNWVHLPSNVILPESWEIRQGVTLPCIDNTFSRVSIFKGLSEYV